jgi:hypothetical protein
MAQALVGGKVFLGCLVKPERVHVRLNVGIERAVEGAPDRPQERRASDDRHRPEDQTGVGLRRRSRRSARPPETVADERVTGVVEQSRARSFVLLILRGNGRGVVQMRQAPGSEGLGQPFGDPQARARTVGSCRVVPAGIEQNDIRWNLTSGKRLERRPRDHRPITTGNDTPVEPRAALLEQLVEVGGVPFPVRQPTQLEKLLS